MFLACRPYCHREGYGDPYNREVGPGAALADTDLYNQAEVQILQENAASPNASLNAYCNGGSGFCAGQLQRCHLLRLIMFVQYCFRAKCVTI